MKSKGHSPSRSVQRAHGKRGLPSTVAAVVLRYAFAIVEAAASHRVIITFVKLLAGAPSSQGYQPAT